MATIITNIDTKTVIPTIPKDFDDDLSSGALFSVFLNDAKLFLSTFRSSLMEDKRGSRMIRNSSIV